MKNGPPKAKSSFFQGQISYKGSNKLIYLLYEKPKLKLGVWVSRQSACLAFVKACVSFAVHNNLDVVVHTVNLALGIGRQEEHIFTIQRV